MVHDKLKETKGFNEAIEALRLNKPKKKIYLKAAEELNELSTKLLQWVNKPEKIDDDMIAEEIVDVQQHIILLEQLFDEKLLDKWIKDKTNKLLKSATLKKYSDM